METKALVAPQFDWNDSKMQTQVKATYGADLTVEEWNLFLAIGQFTGLNPFLREIYAVKYGKDSPASIIIGRDGYRKSAQRHKEYDFHSKATVYENDEFEPPDAITGVIKHKPNLKNPGKIIGAYCLVKRKSSSRANYNFVRFDEYTQSSKNPDGTPKMKKYKDKYSHQWKEYEMKPTTWDTKPSTMIEKVAEAQGLRMTFQELFAGTYDESEINEDEMRRSVTQPTYDPEEAIMLSQALLNCRSSAEVVKVRADFIEAYQKGIINAEETEKLKVEFSKAKAAFEKTPNEPPKDLATDPNIIDGDVSDGKVEPSYVSPSRRHVETHGVEDSCDDKHCIIHGIS